MNARVRNIFIELIGDLDCLFSVFLTLRNMWWSLGEVWDLWFNVGSNFKARALSHLPVAQTGNNSILTSGVVLGLQ